METDGARGRLEGEQEEESAEVAQGREQGQRAITRFLVRMAPEARPRKDHVESAIAALSVRAEHQPGCADPGTGQMHDEVRDQARARAHATETRPGFRDLCRYFRPRLQKCMEVGWTVQTENALNPSWVYHTWDPAQKCQVVAKDPPLKHAECLRMIDTLIEHLPKDGVLTKFSTPKGLHKTYDVEVSPFNLTLCLRGTERSVPSGTDL